MFSLLVEMKQRNTFIVQPATLVAESRCRDTQYNAEGGAVYSTPTYFETMSSFTSLTHCPLVS